MSGELESSMDVESPQQSIERSSESDRPWQIVVASLLWAAFLGIAIWLFIYGTRVMPTYQNNYEGLGNALPSSTRFFMEGRVFAISMMTIPPLALLAGVLWRIRRGAGLIALGLIVVLGLTWMIAFERAMTLPIRNLQDLLNF